MDIAKAATQGWIYGIVGAIIGIPIYWAIPSMFRIWIYHPLVGLILHVAEWKIVNVNAQVLSICLKLSTLTGMPFTMCVAVITMIGRALIVMTTDWSFGITHQYLASLYGAIMFAAIGLLLQEVAVRMYRAQSDPRGKTHGYLVGGYIVAAAVIYIVVANAVFNIIGRY